MTETVTARTFAKRSSRSPHRGGVCRRPKLPLSAFIICLNEEEYLGNCIESLTQCAEIIIVDSGSPDGTQELVQRYVDEGWPIRFVHEDWRGYAGQKQFALEQCSQPWCLSIDADERLDQPLKDALPKLLEAPESTVGWRIARRPYLIGYGYTPARAHERRNLRLIRNGREAFDQSLKVHEGIVPKGHVEIAKQGSLLHFRPLPIEEQILKENKYSSLKVDQLIEMGKSPRRFRLFLNPPLYFLRLYLRHGLWRCGIPGFIQAMTGAVYSFLTESKMYQRHALRRKPSVDDLRNLDP
jgi:glycosyltransferase involved in cell wall biosynthesis